MSRHGQSRDGRAHRLRAGLLALGLAPGAATASDAFYEGFYGRFQPPLALPQTLRATIRVPVADQHGAQAPGDTPIDTLRDLVPALAACWRAPEGLAWMEHTEITTRFALRRDGSLIGTPRVTFSSLPSDTHARAVLVQATLDALRRCTPARITPALGGAIAGRPFSLRFVYDGPRGRKA